MMMKLKMMMVKMKMVEVVILIAQPYLLWCIYPWQHHDALTRCQLVGSVVSVITRVTISYNFPWIPKTYVDGKYVTEWRWEEGRYDLDNDDDDNDVDDDEGRVFMERENKQFSRDRSETPPLGRVNIWHRLSARYCISLYVLLTVFCICICICVCILISICKSKKRVKICQWEW